MQLAIHVVGAVSIADYGRLLDMVDKFHLTSDETGAVSVQASTDAADLMVGSPEPDRVGTELLDTLPGGIAILREGRFAYVNRHLLNLLGLENIDALLGKPVWETAVTDDRALVRSRYLKLERHRILPERYTYRAEGGNGSTVCLEVATSRIEVDGKVAELASIVDVSALKAAEAALSETKNRYRTVLDEIEDGFGEIDLTGKVTFCNESFNRIYGYPKAELIGLDYRSYLDRETAREVYKAYNRVYVTGIPNKGYAYEIICKDGRRRIIENSISLKKDREGQPVAFRSVVRDITDRRRAAEELSRHRSRLTAIFSSVRDAIITVDTDMRVIEANKAVKSICGMDSDDITGKIFKDVHNSCNKSCHILLRETLDRKEPIREYRIECRSGKVAVVNCSPLKGADGRFLGAVMVSRDISRLNELEKELKERHQFHNIIGKSVKMQGIYGLVEDLANIETTVLITGESGTGKELVAKAIHNSGNRAFETFVAVNCSALTENLLESELFGHVKGAFTGAVKDKDGRFMIANGGTILLDEIGEISPQIQVKLLRVLQEKEFERVGDTTPLKVDVRVIACTNRDLEELTRQRLFREDLYYRLKVMEIKLPLLRERREDIPLLVDHFCQLLNKRFRKQIQGVSDEVLSVLMNYHWPGNVRELEHAMERAWVLCRGQSIALAHLPPEIVESLRNRKAHASADSDSEIENMIRALERTDWNKAKAARLLGVDRSTIYRRIRKYKLSNPAE